MPDDNLIIFCSRLEIRNVRYLSVNQESIKIVTKVSLSI